MTNRITWDQFKVCNTEDKSIQFRFEDLCRQIFIYEFLPKDKKGICLHSNPNNPGLETDPVYNEETEERIGFQVKFFDSSIGYAQIKKSAEKIIEHYLGKVDKVYLFCNKEITSSSKQYEETVDLLREEGIEIQLVTDTAILDFVRKYDNLGLYYFKQHYLDKKWFKNNHNKIVMRLGERYDQDFNIDTSIELKLSLFSHDLYAVDYLNNKKKELLEKTKKLGYEYNKYSSYQEKLRSGIIELEDVSLDNIEDVILWDEKLKESIKIELDKFENQLIKKRNKLDELLNELQKAEDGELRVISYEIRLLENLVNLSNSLKLTTKEIKLLKSKVLMIKGRAGIGKTHLLANQVEKLQREDRNALMLLGGDYLDDSEIRKQIMSKLSLDFSFLEMLSILNTQGEKENRIIPICIDALNETPNKQLWKTSLLDIIGEVEKMTNIKLIVSYREEYEKVLINEKINSNNSICKLTHIGFAEETFEATKRFLEHYKISFIPSHAFNMQITNPLFLKLYCKMYEGDVIELPELYNRLLKYASKKIHINGPKVIRDNYSEGVEEIIEDVISEIAEFVIETSQQEFLEKDICKLPIWNEIGIAPRVFIGELIKEDILHKNIIDEEERLRFVYDQMNDYYCAKAIFKKCKSRKEALENIEKVIVDEGESKLENSEMFTYLCSLYFNKYENECVDIIGKINDEDDRYELFSFYVSSLKWRKNYYLDHNIFFDMCSKYKCSPETVWSLFINNSLKKDNIFNAEGLHEILSKYSLPKRDQMWTTSINNFSKGSEYRIVQLLEMYNRGEGIKTSDKEEARLLLTLMSWLLTSSNRWLRDITSKAMIEIFKNHFDLCEVILEKFKDVNDPYVIQRLFGIVWGVCMKRESEYKDIFKSLVTYVYENIFGAEQVYADILLRDYARLIVERYMYEYPEEHNFSIDKIMPPYKSAPILKVPDYGYLENNNKESGERDLINSMRFNFSNWYGDFGRYIFQSALNDFEVNQREVFNYAIHYIFDVLGYSNQLCGEYDNGIAGYDAIYNNTTKIERIGKKYQWIAMYNILARISDNCMMKNGKKYRGPWEPYVRDFDPSLNENFIFSEELPKFDVFEKNKAKYEIENKELSLANIEEDYWIFEDSSFFDIQRSSLVVKDTNGIEWVTLTNYKDNKSGRIITERYQAFNWTYAYFVTNKQLKALKECTSEKIESITCGMSVKTPIYVLYNKEYPWSIAYSEFFDYHLEELEIPTGKKIKEQVEKPDILKNTKKNSFIEMLNKKLQKEYFKNLKNLKEIDEIENLGKILCSAADLLWEEQYDASKKDTISFFVPCKEIIEYSKLKFGKIDGAFYDSNNKLAAFDLKVINQGQGLIVRKDIIDKFIKSSNLNLVWFVNGEKEIRTDDFSLGVSKYSEWTGALFYEEGTVNGEIQKRESKRR